MSSTPYPHSFHIEITEGCCLNCDFCGVWLINNYRKVQGQPRIRFMRPAQARRIAKLLL